MARFILLGIALVFGVVLISHLFGHHEAQAVPIYGSLAACKAERPAAECDQAFASAAALHDGSAPHYATLTSCEDLYGPGQCVPRGSEGSGGWFIPAMAGFMLGHALGGSQMMIAQPIYVNREGYAFSGGAMIGGYHRSCLDYGNCGSGYASGGGYVYPSSSSGGTSSAFWSRASYPTRSVSVPQAGIGASITKPFSGSGSSGAVDTARGSSTVARGGFGSSAHAFGSAGG
jgi:uncharacterized protein YgiB involved in biofilm formation